MQIKPALREAENNLPCSRICNLECLVDSIRLRFFLNIRITDLGSEICIYSLGGPNSISRTNHHPPPLGQHWPALKCDRCAESHQHLYICRKRRGGMIFADYKKPQPAEFIHWTCRYGKEHFCCSYSSDPPACETTRRTGKMSLYSFFAGSNWSALE